MSDALKPTVSLLQLRDELETMVLKDLPHAYAALARHSGRTTSIRRSSRDRLAGQELTTFFTMRGLAATTDERRVVGRAVRGWQEKPWTANDVFA